MTLHDAANWIINRRIYGNLRVAHGMARDTLGDSLDEAVRRRWLVPSTTCDGVLDVNLAAEVKADLERAARQAS